MTWRLDSAVVSDRGCIRELNEDSARIVRPGDDEMFARRGMLVVVADGMGGHSAGEVASQMAVDTIARAYYELGECDESGESRESHHSPHSPDSHHSHDSAAALVAALQDANRAIFAHASQDRALTGMGTTCVALALVNGMAHAAHVGDSRLYLIRRGGIYQMTNDDSAVGEMVNRGVLSKEDARRHHDKNVILKALGTQPDVEVSSWPAPLPLADGDAFLLCSDGLTDLVDDHELAAAVEADADCASVCQALIAAAKARGGFDNIAAALVRTTASATANAAPPTNIAVKDTREWGVHS
jgi:protein phosphatase